MAGCSRRRRVRVRWVHAVVGVCVASASVVAPAAPGDAEMPIDQVSVDSTETGVYFDQVGLAIDGGGVVMSADGNRLAADTTRQESERLVSFVQVFDWDGVGWTQVGADIDEGNALAISADGSRVAVGAVGLHSRLGYVQVHEWDGAAWSPLGPVMYGETAGEGFAQSVELSADGGRMLVGTADRAKPGSVRVLEWDGAGWSRLGADIEGDAGFGWSAAMVGDRVAISEAPQFVGDDSDRTVAGEVRVFDWDGAGWSQVGGDIEAVGDDVALSGSGDRLAVGMRGDWDMGPTGRVWIADLVGDSWVVVDDSGEQVWGRPAQSVALSADGRRLVYSGNRLNGPIDVSPGETVVRDELPTGWADVGVINGAYYTSSDGYGLGLSADADRVAIGGRSSSRVFDISATPPPPLASPVSLVPARLLDSRHGEATVDGVSAGIGRRSAGSVTEVTVAGRGGVAADARAVILNVAAVLPDADGHLSVYPCGAPAPLASNLNYAPGQVIANSVFTEVGADGTVCVHTHASTDLVVDVGGYTTVRSGLLPIGPARLMDSRTGTVVTGYETWDEVDRLAAGSVTEFAVSGGPWPLGGLVPYTAKAVMLNVTAVLPEASGHLTVFPCGEPIPLASSLNYAAGDVIASSAFTRIGDNGNVCVHTHATTDVVVDVSGYTPSDDGLRSLVPARLLDSRGGAETVDGVSAGIGRRPAGSVTEVSVTDRGGVPSDAAAVVLDVISVLPDAAGFLTVYPCGTPRPLASSLNSAAGQVIANSVFTQVGVDGKVCIYTLSAVDIVVDVTGHT